MPVDEATKLKLKEKYGQEQVFVVPFNVLGAIKDKFTRFQHFQSIWNMFDNVGRYVFRYDAEYEPSLQQLIPYILVVHPDGQRFYVAKRIKGEERLVDRISLGFGGHINPCDGTKDVLFRALFRELHEELDIETQTNAVLVGYVRDFKSQTNDHTGCVFVVQAENVAIKEKDNLEGVWMTVDEMEQNYYKFEGWAKHIIDYLIENGKKF